MLLNDTPNLKPKHSLVKALLFSGVALLFVAGLFMYGNRMVDALLANRYVASAEVAEIHDNLKLTTEGSNLLYASAPAIENSQSFNEDCSSVERTQAILGCYNTRKIYLFDITNPQLAGAEEVTAAHEMLHAAYDRLNMFERPVVDKLVTEEYDKLKDDAELKALVAYYEKSEPGALSNELHSIIGTTITELSPDLETYYARYFSDRQVVVGMNVAYNAVFKQVEARSKQLSSQIEAMKPQIDAELGQYRADLQALDTDIASFNARVKSGGYTTQAAFNTARLSLVNRVNALNARREAVNNTIASYNELIAEQNKLSVQVEQLNSSINAAPAAGGV